MFDYNICNPSSNDPKRNLKRVVERLDIDFNFENTWEDLDEDEKIELATMLTRYKMILRVVSMKDHLKKSIENKLISKREKIKKNKMNEKDRGLYEVLKWYDDTNIHGNGERTAIEAVENSFQEMHDIDVHKYFDVETIDIYEREWHDGLRKEAEMRVSHTELGEVEFAVYDVLVDKKDK